MQLKAPPAETEEARADVGQGHLEAMSSEEHGARPDARAKIQGVATALLLGKAQRRDIGERRRVLAEGVPPHQLIEHGLALVTELFDGPSIIWVHLVLPFAPHIGHRVEASTLDLS